MMKRFATLAVAAALSIGAGAGTTVLAAPMANDGEQAAVQVTVNYKGKGTVDASHRVWIWLFDTPDIGPSSMPIAEMSVEKNGGTATFDGVSAAQVWIAVAYDQQGVMAGSAPPPSGSPVGIHASDTGAPAPVKPGDKAPAVVTFDDSQRMP